MIKKSKKIQQNKFKRYLNEHFNGYVEQPDIAGFLFYTDSYFTFTILQIEF